MIEYSINMINKNEEKMEEMIVEILEEFDKLSATISSDMGRSIIARAVVKKFKKMYDFSLKYYYS
tara:strand:- start:3784 stop:3978 length:195 start_codon:yes stop_codon:yes gene_type:complete